MKFDNLYDLLIDSDQKLKNNNIKIEFSGHTLDFLEEQGTNIHFLTDSATT